MRILILGTVRPAHVLLKDQGHDVVLFMSIKTAAPADISFGYESLVYFSENASDQQYLDQALALHKHQPINAVCCFNDDVQAAGILIAEALNLPFPINKDVLDNVSDKSKTRELVRQAGFDSTSYCVAADKEDASNYLNEHGFPAIVKPLSATGSTGVFKVNTIEEFERCDEEGLSYPLLLEEFLVGKEYSVEAISENGEHRVVAVTQKIIDDRTFVELGHVVPAPLNELQFRQVEEFVCEVIKAVGIQHGASHTEIMMTTSGPRLIETHSRLGGDRIFELVRLATGVDLLLLTARQAIGDSILEDYDRLTKQKNFAAVKFIVPAVAAKLRIASIENIEKAKSMPGVSALVLTKNAGDYLVPITNSFERAGFCVTFAQSAEQAMERADDAVAALKYNLLWQHEKES